jgi:hypothetical protein
MSLYRLSARSSSNLALEVKSLAPECPGLALAPIQAKALLFGDEPWVFTLLRGETQAGLAFGSLRRGRLSSALTVTVTSTIPLHDAFWDGLLRFASTHSITRLSVESVALGTGRAPIPALPGETGRYSSIRMYVLDLSKESVEAEMSSNHRRNVKKAQKHGAEIVIGASPEAVREHLALIDLSLLRRSQRGEPTNLRAQAEEVARLLRLPNTQLFQARVDGEVVSSKLVYTVDDYAFYDSGGSSPKGMAVGASHLLMYEIITALRARKVATLNLDVASVAAGGLARYKLEFGSQVYELDRVTVEWDTLRRRAVNGLHTLLRWPTLRRRG